MRILLLGKTGQLGWELNRTLPILGDVTALDSTELDITQPDQVQDVIHQFQPLIIINATAYTAVDMAENEPKKAMLINGDAPALLADLATVNKAAFIHFSTDYVFDGDKGSEYKENDPPNPLNVYGKSKLTGELAIQEINGAYLIIRTSWVYSLRGNNFVTKVLKWSRRQTTLRIVSDQIANPTWARMLAEATAQLLAGKCTDVCGWLHERRGIYHLAGSGYASRLELTEAILRYDPSKEEQITKTVVPALTADFSTGAERPKFSALNCDLFKTTFGFSLPHWEFALELALASNNL